MRRRPSGSTSDEDQDTSSSEVVTAPQPGHGDKLHELLKDSARTPKGETYARDRRKDNNASTPRPSTDKTQLWNTTAPTTKMEKETPTMNLLAKDITPDSMVECHNRRRLRFRNPWSCSLLTLLTTALAFGILFVIAQSFLTRQLDPKGCQMSYMRPAFYHFSDFDTEHTRFATKYSLYFYREGGIDEDIRVTYHVSVSHGLADILKGQRCSGLIYPWQCRKLQTSSTHRRRSSLSLPRRSPTRRRRK